MSQAPVQVPGKRTACYSIPPSILSKQPKTASPQSLFFSLFPDLDIASLPDGMRQTITPVFTFISSNLEHGCLMLLDHCLFATAHIMKKKGGVLVNEDDFNVNGKVSGLSGLNRRLQLSENV
jgi:hypothetical protein